MTMLLYIFVKNILDRHTYNYLAKMASLIFTPLSLKIIIICDAILQTNSQNYCSNRKAQKANPGIQRLTKPHYEPSGIVYQESHTIFTSVFAHQVNPRATVVWIGTFDGYILKVNESVWCMIPSSNPLKFKDFV